MGQLITASNQWSLIVDWRIECSDDVVLDAVKGLDEDQLLLASVCEPNAASHYPSKHQPRAHPMDVTPSDRASSND